jgi:hypothetical protein
MLDIHFNYICDIFLYLYIYNRVEMREGPLSHRDTVEGKIVTPSSLFYCVAYLRVQLTICELKLMLDTEVSRNSFNKKILMFLPEEYH